MKKNILICILCLIGFTSCEKWLDVQPGTKIKSDVLLTTEEGFLDAAAGVYTLMKSENLYGKEMTFGFTDVVIQTYNSYFNTLYQQVGEWNYEDAHAKEKIKNMFAKSYNAIANCNNILDQIDAKKDVFRGNNYNLVKGEMLGLRAYLHFDMMRLYASMDLNSNAIPYALTLSSDIVPTYTGKEVIDLLIKDLTNAKTCLEEDPLKTGEKSDNLSEFDTKRQQRFNYFATVATMARVSMWAGRYSDAFNHAKEIVDVQEQIFPWIISDNISGAAKDRDYTFSTEHIFSLNVYNLDAVSKKWFISPISEEALFSNYTLEQTFADKYGTANDYRKTYLCEKGPSVAPIYGNYLFYKYYQPEKFNPLYAQKMPLIRVSEMYYIMSECYLKENNGTKAIEMLEKVRRHRGVNVIIPTTIPNDEIATQITQEYRKEFMCEGQTFYYYKRNKFARFPDNWKDTPERVYTLPFPDDEIEFGNRK